MYDYIRYMLTNLTSLFCAMHDICLHSGNTHALNSKASWLLENKSSGSSYLHPSSFLLYLLFVCLSLHNLMLSGVHDNQNVLLYFSARFMFPCFFFLRFVSFVSWFLRMGIYAWMLSSISHSCVIYFLLVVRVCFLVLWDSSLSMWCWCSCLMSTRCFEMKYLWCTPDLQCWPTLVYFIFEEIIIIKKWISDDRMN